MVGRNNPSLRGERKMAKVVNCRDVGVDCDFEARAETEEELFHLF